MFRGLVIEDIRRCAKKFYDKELIALPKLQSNQDIYLKKSPGNDDWSQRKIIQKVAQTRKKI